MMTVKPIQLAITFLMLCLIQLVGFAETTIIQGNGVYYKGKSLEIRKYLDLFTFESAVLSKQVIPSNGNFKLEVNIETTGLYLIKIDKIHAHIHLEPGNQYTIVLEEPEDLDKYNPAKDVFILPDIFESNGQLNHDITEIEKTINRFLIKYSYLYGRSVSGKIQAPADSLTQLLHATYADKNQQYLNDYLHYRLALFNLQTNHSKQKVFDKYFSGREIAYHQLPFAQSFSLFFDEYFSYLNPNSEQRFTELVDFAIKNKSYSKLDESLSRDPYLKRTDFRALLMTTQLYEVGREKKYPLINIIALLDSVIMKTKDDNCRVIAANAEQILNRLAPGTMAPDFQFSDLFGNIFKLSEYQGRYIYIQFFDDFDAETLKEMSLMKVLKEGYGTDIAMFSISVSEPLDRIREISGKHGFNWYFGKAMHPDQSIEEYQIRAYPSYFYINKQLEIITAPAAPPGSKIEKMFAKAWNEEHPNKELLFKLQPPEVKEPIPLD